MKAIKQSQLRDITDAYDREDISYSKMNEMLNSLADSFSIDFVFWVLNGYIREFENNPEKTLEIYKKQL